MNEPGHGRHASATAGIDNHVDPTMQPIAAVDLGTNNCRLLVARPDADSLTIVDSYSRIVRLGEGLGRTGTLSEAAMMRAIHALRTCARIIARHDVAQARCVATEACRRARNGTAFVERAQLASGLSLDVLDHEEEARLALLGCLSLADPRYAQVLMMDVGGGSTELAWLERGGPKGYQLASLSLQIGVVTLAEQFGADPDDDGYRAMQEVVWAALDRHPGSETMLARVRPDDLQGIGTSGTVTTLAAMHLHLARYDRSQVDGIWLPPDALAQAAKELRAMDTARRAVHPCIGPGRADLVVAGSAIVEALWARLPFTKLRVADRGLREGILATLVGERLETAVERHLAGAVPDALPALS
ncbi:MAG: Ppx/GppA phosphatase family protein [Pseudomonadota bacterium]